MVAREVREVPVASACVPNIGRRGRRRRAMLGVVWLGVTAVVVAALVSRHAATPLFLVVAPFIGLASLYFFQAKGKT